MYIFSYLIKLTGCHSAIHHQYKYETYKHYKHSTKYAHCDLKRIYCNLNANQFQGKALLNQYCIDYYNNPLNSQF